MLPGYLHQSNGYEESQDGEGEHVDVVVAVVAVPVVNGAHGAAGLQPEPAHQANGRRGSTDKC